MVGHISKRGYLLVKRGQNLQEQLCQWNKDYFCCDKCVKFGEPQEVMNGDKTEKIGVGIRLCHKDQLFFTEFSDNR
jgi:hypothetical protein